MNIKSADIHFGPITLFNGQSGMGKSAILDAIVLLLTNKKRGDKFQEYVKQGCDSSHIQMGAKIFNKQIDFDMILGKGSKYTIQYDGKEYINTIAEEFLKTFDIDYFADIIISMQMEDDITKLSTSRRSQYLQKLLNFDFSKIIEKISIDIDKIKEDLQAQDNIIQINNQLIISEKARIKKPVETILSSDKIIELTKCLEESQLKIDQSQKAQEESNKINELIHLIQKNINENQSKSIKLQKELNSKDIETKETKKAIEKELKLANDNFNLKVENLNLEEDLKIKEQAFKTTEVELEAAKKDNFELTIKLKESQRLKQLIDEGKCPHCGQSTKDFAIGELQKHLGKRFSPKVLDLVQKDLDVSNDLVKSLKQNITSLNNDIIALKQLIKNNKVKIDSTDITKVDKLQSNYAIFLKEFDDIEEKIELLTADEEGLKKSLYDEKTKLLNLNFDIEDIHRLSRSIIEINNKIKDNELLIKSNDQIKKDNLKINGLIENYTNLIVGATQQKQVLISQLDIKQEAKSVFEKDLPTFMVIKTCATLESEMNDIIHSVFPSYDVQLKNDKFGVSFFYTKDRSIDIKRKDKWINSRMSSGFEKALLTMSFKLALAKMYGLDFLVLDECEASADQESSEKLYELILNEDQFNQCIIITHKNELKEFIPEIAQKDVTMYDVVHGVFTN